MAKVIKVPSFTDPSIMYEIDTEALTCSCPAFSKTGGSKPCKHLVAYVPELLPKPKPVIRPSVSVAMSALIKATRLRDLEEAIKWLWYINTFPDARYRLLRRLFVMAGEDSLTVSVQQRGANHFSNYKHATLLSMAAEVVRICKTPNWYECKEGREWLWIQCKSEEGDRKAHPMYKASTSEIIHHIADCVETSTLEAHIEAIKCTDYQHATHNKYNAKFFYEELRGIVVANGSNPLALAQVDFCLTHYRALSKDVNYDMQIISRMFFETLGDQTTPKVLRGEVLELLYKAEAFWEAPEPMAWHYLDGIHTGGAVDSRFAGTCRSMLGQCRAFMKYGRVSPDDVWPPEFWQIPDKPLDDLYELEYLMPS